ncbi:formylglycine-generating enzyme family protein [Roseibium salinum]|uniref:Formylglycine-generating enzyme family protein n=1 Tax=Roseibium salinum TaxID=1604349 RepID=A0ABT3QVM2_9HYPH|nr:formylglycine-generating enzyme family protein [Roseibium sp. DSM 29163]MCX2720978.1 formylglycine-generating enzyme family protein [Roseibium sp. DSM 29163]
MEALLRLPGIMLVIAALSTHVVWAGMPDGPAVNLTLIEIPGGTFAMGSEQHHVEEGPVREVTVASFRLSATEVTNAQFRAFVEATGYITTAERTLDPAEHPTWPPELLKPGSMVFRMPDQVAGTADIGRWSYVAGANWRSPEGPGSSIDGRDEFPVVQVSHEDAAAFAAWAGGRLPTEAEWENAARGGIDGAEFTWGETYDPEEGWKANSWQGVFPAYDSSEDGFHGIAPVASFPPNGYGLHDMAGNVWEHVADWYVPMHPDQNQTDPHGPPRELAAHFSDPSTGARHVIKGGSWLCAPNFCYRYRPAARQGQEQGLGTNHIGFRVAFDAD